METLTAHADGRTDARTDARTDELKASELKYLDGTYENMYIIYMLKIYRRNTYTDIYIYIYIYMKQHVSLYMYMYLFPG